MCCGKRVSALFIVVKLKNVNSQLKTSGNKDLFVPEIINVTRSPTSSYELTCYHVFSTHSRLKCLYKGTSKTGMAPSLLNNLELLSVIEIENTLTSTELGSCTVLLKP